MNTSLRDLCIVVSHYNARPQRDLINLLRQLKEQISNIESKATVDVIVVVNMGESKSLDLPLDLQQTTVQYRENSGFNMGSWEHGWRSNPNYYAYLFLQDECIASNPNAIANYWSLLKQHPNSMLGESLFFFRGWSAFLKSWPSDCTSLQSFATRNSIPLGLTASHLQTLALAATRETLTKLGGFILADDKMEAIAAEVLLSRRAVSLGIAVEQSAWFPFANFSHEQWSSIKLKSRSIAWNLSKFIWYVIFGWRDLSRRMTP